MSATIYFERAGISLLQNSTPFGYFVRLRLQTISKGLRILTRQYPRLSLPRSIKSKDHTYVWPKLLYAPRAGFEPATNRLTVDRSTAELPRNFLDLRY